MVVNECALGSPRHPVCMLFRAVFLAWPLFLFCHEDDARLHCVTDLLIYGKSG